MTFVSQEEVIKLSKIANIQIHEDEIAELTKQLQEVLSYAACVDEIVSATHCPEMPKAVNVWREDIVRPSIPELIMKEAPLSEGDYFVVPAIIKQQE